MNGSGKGQGTRQIKTLSLIAGKGSTSKHNRQHQQHRAAGPDVGSNEGNTHERGEQTGLIAWDMLDTSPPAASRTKQTNSKKTTLERSKWSSTSTTDDGSSPFVDNQSSERNQETAGNGAVDFGNIWDGFAATPNGKDWKAMLAPTYVPYAARNLPSGSRELSEEKRMLISLFDVYCGWHPGSTRPRRKQQISYPRICTGFFLFSNLHPK
jgi:hypothetical protein